MNATEAWNAIHQEPSKLAIEFCLCEGSVFEGIDDLEGIDEETSLEAYLEGIRTEVQSSFPGAEIVVEYGPSGTLGDTASLTHPDVPDWLEAELANDILCDIAPYVWDRGEFWVEA